MWALTLGAEEGGIESMWVEVAKQALGAENGRCACPRSGTGKRGLLMEPQWFFGYGFPIGLSRYVETCCQFPRTNHQKAT